jgi:hypothetical protein
MIFFTAFCAVLGTLVNAILFLLGAFSGTVFFAFVVLLLVVRAFTAMLGEWPRARSGV